jgi:hypothetical protein
MIKTLLQENKEFNKLVPQLKDLIDKQTLELAELRYYTEINKKNNIVVNDIVVDDIVVDDIVVDDVVDDIVDDIVVDGEVDDIKNIYKCIICAYKFNCLKCRHIDINLIV